MVVVVFAVAIHLPIHAVPTSVVTAFGTDDTPVAYTLYVRVECPGMPVSGLDEA